MLTKHIVIALGLFATTTAFAQTAGSPSPAPTETTFEAAGLVEAKLFLPENLMKGGLHTVNPQAENDGLLNTYFLHSGNNVFEVTTGLALRIRIRELYAIDKLRGTSKTEEFTKSLATAGKKKVESVAGIVKDPVGTLKRVPQGASRFFGRIGEGLKGGKSDEEGNAAQGLTGVQKAKVALAAKLGVSPYSTNQELQEQLTNVARATAGGGLVVNVALMPIGAVNTVLNMNQTLQQTLVTSTPEDLRVMNRKKLLALGVTERERRRISHASLVFALA